MADSETLPFPARLDLKPKHHTAPPDEGEETETGNAYATARGLRTPPALRFLRTDGTLKFAMPYGYLPIVWGESPRLILLEYPGFFTVTLAGKNLAVLETRLCDHRVTWIRECDEAQAAALPVAVTRIAIARVYPSHAEHGTELPTPPARHDGSGGVDNSPSGH
jgi:hypothetical protein